MLNYSLLRDTELETDPFEHVVLRDFVEASALPAIRADFPKLNKPGSVPLTELDYGPAFRRFISALQSEQFEALISDKFHVDLSGRPTMFTARARCRATDGKIHNDSTTKIITILIYLNDDEWPQDGGRLRLLRGSSDIEDYVVEVPPAGGTLIAFLRSDRSWHGHKPYEGPRRAIQMNWVTDRDVVRREQFRHRLSWWLKKLTG